MTSKIIPLPFALLKLESVERKQGSTVTIKSPYVITYMCQNFAVREVHWLTPKSIYEVSYLLPSDLTS